MSVCGVKEYLQQWGQKTSGGVAANSVTRLPRSFRPHRIVPRVFLGALGDVKNTSALCKRLLPERMLLVVCACAKDGPPRLELRRVFSSARGAKRSPAEWTGGDDKESSSSLPLAVCSWERLEEIVRRQHRGEDVRDSEERTIAIWIENVFNCLSFDSDKISNTYVPQDEKNNDENENKVGMVYLKLSLPWKDEPTFPVNKHFEVATSLMRVVTCELKGAVVCYCVAGISRSATLVCAFLICCWYKDCGGGTNLHAAGDVVREVVEFVRKIRFCVRPNDGFTRQLTEYVEMLYST